MAVLRHDIVDILKIGLCIGRAPRSRGVNISGDRRSINDCFAFYRLGYQLRDIFNGHAQACRRHVAGILLWRVLCR